MTVCINTHLQSNQKYQLLSIAYNNTTFLSNQRSVAPVLLSRFCCLNPVTSVLLPNSVAHSLPHSLARPWGSGYLQGTADRRVAAASASGGLEAAPGLPWGSRHRSGPRCSTCRSHCRTGCPCVACNIWKDTIWILYFSKKNLECLTQLLWYKHFFSSWYVLCVCIGYLLSAN